MIPCSNCGEENREAARFCDNCGAALASSAPKGAEVRKTVTVLFADVVGSTSRGEQTDPESTRRMLSRYFDATKQVIERHGGTVEKFIGDAVMAVFGIPTLHEDDALRAVRAASEMRSAVELLNQELANANWPPISLRTGVNTGEVVAGEGASGHTLVTGDAVNVAARLEQAASPGEVLLGASTYRLVRDGVEAEPMPGLELKGKAEPVEAYRLIELKQRGRDRRHDSPMVDRNRELQLLADAFQRAQDERACYLFTLLGAAGVGKSRLLHEFLSQVRDRATVLRARCLPYGEGITFWPVIELAQAAAQIEPGDSPAVARSKLEELLKGSDERDAILARLSAAIGLSQAAVPADEIFWGVRKLLETVAGERPLVVVIDDLHWAEPTLLDLIDHIADWSREAPILLLAVSRPELLDGRPQWGGGKLNATIILLEPLSQDDSTELINNLIHDESLARTVQSRIGETAEGNPLFVEELVAMLIDQGVLQRRNGGWQAVEDLRAVSVPPSISALVAARLDHLEPSERDVIGRASVVGKIFQRAAVTELSPPERRDGLGAELMALVRKELVRPDRSASTGDEAFRFRHILVRDAAYGSLPKEQRADLHARFADWLERIAGDRLLEYEEVIAYHLEQAHDYRSELGMTDALTDKLGARAAKYLRAAGLRAVARRDAHAADNLLSRAVSLLVDDRERVEVNLRLADTAFVKGESERVRQLLGDVSASADRTGDELLRARADMWIADFATLSDPNADAESLLRLSQRVEVLSTERGDLVTQAEALQARGWVALIRCRWGEMLAALEEARSLLRGRDDPDTQSRIADIHDSIAMAMSYGPTPAPEAIARIDEMAIENASMEFSRYWSTARLLAMQAEIVEARARAQAGAAYLVERGLLRLGGSYALNTAAVEAFAGELQAAEQTYAQGIAILRPMGDTGVVSTLAAERADILYRLGRFEEMEEAIHLAQETGATGDIATQAGWRVPAAQRAADEGRFLEADTLMSEALAIIDPTDYLELRGRVFEAHAHVAARRGTREAWKAALERALVEHERKGNLVMAGRVRDQLAAGPPDAVAPQQAPR